MKPSRPSSLVRRKSDRAIRLLRAVESEPLSQLPREKLLSRFCDAAIRTGYRRALVAEPLEVPSEELAVLAEARAADPPDPIPLDLGWIKISPTSGVSSLSLAESYTASDLCVNPLYAPWAEEARRAGYSSALAITPHLDGHPRLIVALFAKEASAFDETERAILEMVACCLCSVACLGESEARLRAQVEQHEDLLNHMNEIVYVGDATGTVTYINPAVERILGWP